MNTHIPKRDANDKIIGTLCGSKSSETVMADNPKSATCLRCKRSWRAYFGA